MKTNTMIIAGVVVVVAVVGFVMLKGRKSEPTMPAGVYVAPTAGPSRGTDYAGIAALVNSSAGGAAALTSAIAGAINGSK